MRGTKTETDKANELVRVVVAFVFGWCRAIRELHQPRIVGVAVVVGEGEGALQKRKLSPGYSVDKC